MIARLLRLRRLRRLSLAALLAAFLAGCAEAGPQSCQIHAVADLPLLPGRHGPVVEATLNGQRVAFLVDTGAAISTITEAAADRFALSYGPDGRIAEITGIGGTVMAPIATIHHLGLGHGIGRDVTMPVAGRFGGPIDGVPIVGLFGADFMSNYDVDLDLPRRRFRMYRLVDCGSSLAPVDAPFFTVPFNTEQTRIMLDVRLNGRKLRAMLDSGSSHTLIPITKARDAGVGKADLAGDRIARMVGIDENKVVTYVHRFGSLQVGDETLQNFQFGVADTRPDDMILGDDFLRFNEVWISYPLQRLYIHPATQDPVVHQVP